MTNLPNPDRVIIDLRKLAEYLLSRSHPIGRGKARFFEGLGFSAASPDVLAQAFRQLVREPSDVTSQDTATARSILWRALSLDRLARRVSEQSGSSKAILIFLAS